MVLFSISCDCNSRLRIAGVLYYQGERRLIRGQDNFENLLSTTVEIEI